MCAKRDWRRRRRRWYPSAPAPRRTASSAAADRPAPSGPAMPEHLTVAQREADAAHRAADEVVDVEHDVRRGGPWSGRRRRADRATDDELDQPGSVDLVRVPPWPTTCTVAQHGRGVGMRVTSSSRWLTNNTVWPSSAQPVRRSGATPCGRSPPTATRSARRARTGARGSTTSSEKRARDRQQRSARQIGACAPASPGVASIPNRWQDRLGAVGAAAPVDPSRPTVV